MLRRRLIALLASVLLLPSTLVGAGDSCIAGGLIPVTGERGDVGVGRSGHDHRRHMNSPAGGVHHADTDGLARESNGSSRRGVPHAPAQCIVAAGCGAAAIAAAVVVAIDEPVQVATTVDTDVALAPDSPASGLEPPPPRA
jgi:hypothetical protein